MPSYEFEQFSAVHNYGDLTFSPDGTSVAYITNVSGQFNVWRQPVQTAPDGQPLMPTQLIPNRDEEPRYFHALRA